MSTASGGRAGQLESRRATEVLLALLVGDDPWWARWGRFATATAGRSARQVVRHPRAALELCALHGAFLALRRPGAHRWILVSGTMAVTHLGMLGSRRSLGLANAVTLLRANAPALRGVGAWGGPAAVASDRIDGLVARRVGTTQFGHRADSLADAAFWTWFAVRHEPHPRLRATAVGSWVLPVIAATVGSVVSGRLVEPPRPARLRPAAALQGWLALRAVRRTLGPARR